MVSASVDLDVVLEISVPDDEIVKRLSGRRVHPASGRVYHVAFNPPKIANKDDETGEPLVQRDDDKEDTIRHRLKVYRDQTLPLVDFYRKRASMSSVRYERVSGIGSVEEIKRAVMNALGDARD
jgi:adenylate kinase